MCVEEVDERGLCVYWGVCVKVSGEGGEWARTGGCGREVSWVELLCLQVVMCKAAVFPWF